MKKALFLIPFFALAACGYSVADAVDDIGGSSDFDNGKPIGTSVSTIDSFTQLSAMGPDNIVFKTGAAFSIVATGEADDIESLRYVVKDGRLLIGRKKGSWGIDGGDDVTITVTAPSLSAISLAGSGDLTADKLTGDEVKLSVAGSGSLKVADVTTASLRSSIAGSGDVELAGKATAVRYSVAGSGSVDAAKLVATTADISIAGSGDVEVNATENVKANIAGSGDITVTGGAKCKSSKVGSGEVKCG